MSQPGQEDFFDRMHEWSERKLQLLIKYVEPAVKGTTTLTGGQAQTGKQFKLNL